MESMPTVWMNPPPAGEGMQMTLLPFFVPSDSEIQGDFYFDLPSDVDFEVGRIEIAMNEGTHHMHCFVSQIIWPKDSGVAQKMVMRRDNGSVDTEVVRYDPQFNLSIVLNQSDVMIESETPYLNWVLPKTPNGEQVVIKLEAHHHMIIESHYVNKASLLGGGSLTTPNNRGAIIINLWKSASANTEPASMLMARKTTIKIPPHSDETFTKDCRFTPQDIADTIFMLGMTGHYHSRGKFFRVDKMQDSLNEFGKVVGAKVLQYAIYRNANWSQPPFIGYDPPIMIDRKHGEFLRYTVEYVNNTPKTFNFGPFENTCEMCNLFGWFAPA